MGRGKVGSKGNRSLEKGFDSTFKGGENSFFFEERYAEVYLLPKGA